MTPPRSTADTAAALSIRDAAIDKSTEPVDHLIRKGAYFYRPNKQGYTNCVTDAGRYTRSDAERECKIEPWHMEAVPLSRLRCLSPEVIAYADHLRSLGFTVIAPKDVME